MVYIPLTPTRREMAAAVRGRGTPEATLSPSLSRSGWTSDVMTQGGRYSSSEEREGGGIQFSQGKYLPYYTEVR